MKPSIFKFGGLHALGVALYVALVSSLLFYTPRFLGSSKEDTVLAPIAMLLLFVTSAAITGLLVLGRPLLWYLDGKKKEAVSLVMATLGFLSLITLIFFFVMAGLTRT